MRFAYGALTLCRGPSQAASATHSMQTEQVPSGPYNPGATRTLVWAGPVSLAATSGISVDFFSWGYLDVSVLPVGPDLSVTSHDARRVSPFGHPGITACVRLPQVYRGLPRPSSPVRAKASTVRPCFAWPDHPFPAPLLQNPPLLLGAPRTMHTRSSTFAYLPLPLFYPFPTPVFSNIRCQADSPGEPYNVQPRPPCVNCRCRWRVAVSRGAQNIKLTHGSVKAPAPRFPLGAPRRARRPESPPILEPLRGGVEPRAGGGAAPARGAAWPASSRRSPPRRRAAPPA